MVFRMWGGGPPPSHGASVKDCRTRVGIRTVSRGWWATLRPGGSSRFEPSPSGWGAMAAFLRRTPPKRLSVIFARRPATRGSRGAALATPEVLHTVPRAVRDDIARRRYLTAGCYIAQSVDARSPSSSSGASHLPQKTSASSTRGAFNGCCSLLCILAAAALILDFFIHALQIALSAPPVRGTGRSPQPARRVVCIHSRGVSLFQKLKLEG